MKLSKALASILILLIIILSNASSAQEDGCYSTAKTYLTELESLCAADNGALWGKNLYGPTMLVIPQTREILANQADENGQLVQRDDSLFVGVLADNINLANTSLDWNGDRWTMVRWDALSPDDSFLRNKLLIHESWHRIQEDIGIQAVVSTNTHLDEMRGLILIKLELLVLKKALLSKTMPDKKMALKDALIIRKYRQLVFPNNNENEFERNEGLPEYTGYRLCGLKRDIIPLVLSKQLESAESKDAFANSFAYLTGPAYGFLLDEFGFAWIKLVIQGKNMLEISEDFLSQTMPADTTLLESHINEIVGRYQAESLIVNEKNKNESAKKLAEDYRQKFLMHDQLIIRNTNLNFSYNPQEKLVSLDELGVVYKTMRLTGEWGVLEVNNGIFRSNDWQVFVVAAPKTMDSDVLIEPDYSLTLTPGWEIIKIKEGKYTLLKE